MHWFRALFFAALVGLFVFSGTLVAQDSLHVCCRDQILHTYPYYAWDVALENNMAYLASWGYGVSLVDVSNPDSIFDEAFVYPPC